MTLFRKHVDDFERSMNHGPHHTEERLRRIFDLIDMDGNGTLNLDEVQQFWHKMGWASSERSLKAMFNVADKDGSGAIEWFEFQKFFGTLTSLRDLATPDPDLDWVPPASKRDRRTSAAALPPKVPCSQEVRSFDVSYVCGFARKVKGLVVLKDGRLLAASGEGDGSPKLLAPSGCVRKTYQMHSEALHTLALSSDGKYLATSGAEGVVFVWNAVSGQLMDEIVSGVVGDLCFAVDDNALFGGGQFGTVARMVVGVPDQLLESGRLGKGTATSIVMVTVGVCVSLSRSRTIVLLQEDNLAHLCSLQAHALPVLRVCADHSLSRCISVCERSLRCWDVAGGGPDTEPVAVHAAAEMSPSLKWLCCAFLPNAVGHYAAAAGSDHGIYIFNIKSQEMHAVIQMRASACVLVPCLSGQQLVLYAGDTEGNVAAIEFNGSPKDAPRLLL